MADFPESCENDKQQRAKHRIATHNKNIVLTSLLPVALWSCHFCHVSITRSKSVTKCISRTVTDIVLRTLLY
jgi:hypothetical protein